MAHGLPAMSIDGTITIVVGWRGRDRTHAHSINSRVLYQLSYAPSSVTTACGDLSFDSMKDSNLLSHHA